MAAIDNTSGQVTPPVDNSAGIRAEVFSLTAAAAASGNPTDATTQPVAKPVDSVTGPLVLTDGDRVVAASESTLEARVEQWRKVLDTLDPANPQRIDVPNDKDAAKAFFQLMEEKFGSYNLVKPDAKPGEKGYKEVMLVPVEKAVNVATQERAMTTTADITVDGKTIPAGTQLPVGTIYDGQTIKTADPRVNGMMIGDVFVPNGTAAQTTGGQDAKPPGPGFAGDHIVVQDSAKPGVLDSWPIGPETKATYKPTERTGVYTPTPKPTPSAVIPAGLTVYSEIGGTTSKAGDVIRADGYSVTPESQANSWLGYTDERAHEYVKTVIAQEMLKAHAMGDTTTLRKYSDNMLALEQQRAKALNLPEPTKLAPINFNDPYSMAQDKVFMVAALNADPARAREGLLRLMQEKGVGKEAIDRVRQMDGEALKAKYAEFKASYESSGKFKGVGTAGALVMFLDALVIQMAR